MKNETQYFIIKNKERIGPFSIEDLKSQKISKNTLVWYKKLDDWVKAKDVKEILDIIDVKPPKNPTVSDDIIDVKPLKNPTVSDDEIGLDEEERNIKFISGGIIVIEEGKVMKYKYANFGWRLLARIIDTFIIIIPYYFSLGLAAWLYFTLMYTFQQRTLGQMAVGIKLLSIDNGYENGYPIAKKVGFGKANGKFWGNIIVGFTFYIGYLMMLWTKKSQCLHDMMAGVIVVRKKPLN